MSKYTKQAMKAAFMKLLNEKPFEKIKVKDIVEECQCNRNTFYYYYQDIYALLEELMAEELERAMSRTNDFENWQDGLIAGTRFLLENKRAVYHLYNSSGREEIERYIFRVSDRIIRAYVKQQSEGLTITELDERIIVSFYVHAIVGMFREWLDGRMKVDAETVIHRIGQLLEGNMRRVCERAAKTAE